MEKAMTFPTAGVELKYLLVVSDYARSLAFYRDVLGATLVREISDILCLLSFGGGKVKGAATHPITGRVAVARFFLATGNVFRRSLPKDSRVELAEVNRQPALIIRAGERAYSVLTIEVEAGHIQIIRVVVNPEKLA